MGAEPVTLWTNGGGKDFVRKRLPYHGYTVEYRALPAAEYDAMLANVAGAAACIDRVLAIVGDSHGKPLAQIIGGISAAAHDARAHLAGGEG